MPRSGVLGIIGCYGLSDQIMHLIERDEDIEHLFVVNNGEGLQFIEKMERRSINRNHVLVSEEQLPLKRREGFSVILWLNPENLHNDPSAIRQMQSERLSKMSLDVDSIFFCYGLCRCPEQRIINIAERGDVPINFLTDGDGEVVDDCLGAIMGGKKAYLDHIKNDKGTLFATTGYIETWKRKFQNMDIESIVHEVEGLKHLFEALGYHRVLILDDGLGDREAFERDVRSFSRTFGLHVAREICGTTVFERSYNLAKEGMNGRTAEAYRSGISAARSNVPRKELEPIPCRDR